MARIAPIFRDAKGAFDMPFVALSLTCAALTVYLGFFVQRSSFPAYITAFGSFFVLYQWAVSCFAPQKLLALGIALRVLLLFSLPNLSDDYLRFIWDGRLTLAGYHPFLHPPSYFMENHILVPGITPALYEQLNSPRYFTVYPPVCQAVFAAAAWVSPASNWLAVLVMKLFLLLAEIGTLWLLGKAEREPGTAAVLYALNPLVILELVGNCHFEGAMSFFLLAGILAIRQGKIAAAAGHWALATATKMLPLLFLPIAWRWLGFKKGLVFNVLFGVMALALFAPLIAVLPNIAQSLDLYFREFQFNASLYYLVREVGFAYTGWDIGDFSGPWLALAAFVGILLIAVLVGDSTKNAASRLPAAMMFALLVYMSFSAVVQPWYVCVPLAISLLTRWRFVVLWSGLVGLSYSHYDGGLRQEHFGLIALEYFFVWLFLAFEVWSFYFRKHRSE